MLVKRPFDLLDFLRTFINLERVIPRLDFAMWLKLQYAGKSKETPISLIKEPQYELDKEIDDILRRDRDSLSNEILQCPKCETAYKLDSAQKECAEESCEGSLLISRLLTQEELRDEAYKHLCKKGSLAPIRQEVFSLLRRKMPSQQSLPSADIQLKVQEVLDLLNERLKIDGQRFYALVTGDNGSFVDDEAIDLGGLADSLSRILELRNSDTKHESTHDEIVKSAPVSFRPTHDFEFELGNINVELGKSYVNCCQIPYGWTLGEVFGDYEKKRKKLIGYYQQLLDIENTHPDLLAFGWIPHELPDFPTRIAKEMVEEALARAEGEKKRESGERGRNLQKGGDEKSISKKDIDPSQVALKLVSNEEFEILIGKKSIGLRHFDVLGFGDRRIKTQDRPRYTKGWEYLLHIAEHNGDLTYMYDLSKNDRDQLKDRVRDINKKLKDFLGVWNTK